MNLRLTRPARVSPQRWRLLWRSLPVWIVVVMIAVFGLLRLTANNSGRKAYDAAEYHHSQVIFDRLRVLNVAQRWVADYNAGTSAAQQRQWDDAEPRLTKALTAVPAEWDCRVRLNLVYVIEKRADDTDVTGGHAKAGNEYARARQLLRQGDCGSPSDSPSPTPSTDESSNSPSDNSTSPSSGSSSQSSGSASSSSGSGDQPDPEREAKAAEQAKQRLESKERQSRADAEDNPSPDNSSLPTTSATDTQIGRAHV